MQGTIKELIKQNAHSIFFSHAGKDNDVVKCLIEAISKEFTKLHISEQLPIFIDALSMIGSQEKQYDVIYNAINSCGIFIFFVTENSLTGKWPLLELKIALDAKKKNPDMIILPLYYNTIPNQTPGSITPETEALFPKFSAREKVDELRRHTGIQFPREHFIETFDTFVSMVLDSVVINTLHFEPFYRFKRDQLASFKMSDEKRFASIKKTINECNTANELKKLWLEEINPFSFRFLELLADKTERFTWALSWARSLKYSEEARQANEHRRICKIWAERVCIVFEQLPPDSAERNSFIHLRTMLEIVLGIVLPMDKANAFVNLPSIKNGKTKPGKDWLSKEQVTKIKDHPEYANKLSSTDNSPTMESKFVSLIRLLKLSTLESYIHPQLLGCTPLENEQLMHVLEGGKFQFTESQLADLIKVQAQVRHRQAMQQKECYVKLTQLQPKLTFWQSHEMVQLIEAKQLMKANEKLSELSNKIS